jgi:hypothetical protein
MQYLKEKNDKNLTKLEKWNRYVLKCITKGLDATSFEKFNPRNMK